MMKSAAIVFIFFCSVVAGSTVYAAFSGQTRSSNFYKEEIQLADGACRFELEIEEVEFLLTSVANKYKLVRVRLENIARSPLELSRQADRFDLILRTNNQTTRVRAILNLQEAGPDIWDSLDITMREALAYPLEVPATRDPNLWRSEILYIFFLFPKNGVGSLPVAFEYTIDSLKKTIRIEPPPAMAH